MEAATTTLERRVREIPPTRKPEELLRNYDGKMRVAAYCRVSTDSEEQLNSYEAQKTYYTQKIQDNPDWEMAGIYADEGISGTSLKKRAEFNKMITACKRGRIDFIITKSLSRFARNTVDCLDTVRLLKANGIGVYFEKENINTLTESSEFLVTLFSGFAQAESESLSKNVAWGKEKSAKAGNVHFQYKKMLGYRKGEDGQPEIVPEEAAIVRRIYRRYLDGCTLGKIKRELDELVGLAPVKEYVFGLADNIQVQQRRAAAGFKTASLSMHMIFTGNPGTGKTTIARLVARYLKAIGALKGGQLIEVGRGDLVGRYTGHTAPLTNSVIESALGGVLFIDEAYSLYRGEQDSFGLEAIDTLVKGMEDHRDELVVVLAGYTKEMEVFLTANSGLASRFPNKIEFPDYTADELLDITNVLAKGKGYRLAEGCTFPLLGYYKRRQALDSRTAGNGRLARNTLEKAIFHQSRRLVAEPDAELDLILPGDLEFEE